MQKQEKASKADGNPIEPIDRSIDTLLREVIDRLVDPTMNGWIDPIDPDLGLSCPACGYVCGVYSNGRASLSSTDNKHFLFFNQLPIAVPKAER